MNIISHSSRAAGLATSALRTWLVPQNGVSEQIVDFEEDSDSVSSIDRGQTTFKSTDDCPPRPTKLGVGTQNMLNKLRDEGVGHESLPCSPDMEEESQLGDEAVDSDTSRHIYTFYIDIVGSSKPKPNQDKVQATMRRVVGDVLEKHQYAYNGMIKKLELDGRGEDMSFVTSVAEQLFADGTTNWGRIASLLAFGVVVSNNLVARGRQQSVLRVAKEISTYLLSDQREWLAKNNSWDGFVEFFQVSDPETTVRNTLMAFAGFAGIGATIALLIR